MVTATTIHQGQLVALKIARSTGEANLAAISRENDKVKTLVGMPQIELFSFGILHVPLLHLPTQNQLFDQQNLKIHQDHYEVDSNCSTGLNVSTARVLEVGVNYLIRDWVEGIRGDVWYKYETRYNFHAFVSQLPLI